MSGPAEVVVIAVDGSAYSEAAFDWYMGHMHKEGNTLILAHSGEIDSMPSRTSWDAQTKQGQEKGQQIKEKFKAKLEGKKIPSKFVMDFEKPGEFICKVAKDEKASVIVMGTRGLGKLRRTILGSVSNYVLNHAHVPVLVCRSEEKDKK